MILNVASAAAIEQQAQLLGNVGTGFGVLAGVLLIVSIFLFIKLDIKRVIGEKTGRVERKTIEQLEQETALSGKLQIARSGKKVKRGQTSEMNVQEIFTNLEKDVVGNNQAYGTETTVPLGNAPTEVLQDSPATEVLNHGYEDTMVLNSGYDETSVLSSVAPLVNEPIVSTISAEKIEQPKVTTGVGNFKIIRSIALIHTEEHI